MDTRFSKLLTHGIGAGIGGALTAAILLSRQWVLCPMEIDWGNAADWIAVLATVAIAWVAHSLNVTLKRTASQKSTVAARALCKSLRGVVVRDSAPVSLVGRELSKFLKDEIEIAVVRTLARIRPLKDLPARFYDNPNIGDLPDDLAQKLSSYVQEHELVKSSLEMWFGDDSLQGDRKLSDFKPRTADSLRLLDQQISKFNDASTQLRDGIDGFLSTSAG